MEAEVAATSINKPSGLPRPSRLPVLRNKASQVLVPTQEDVVEPTRTTNAPPALPKLQKRQSIPALTRPGLSNPASKPLVSKNNVNVIKHSKNDSLQSQGSVGRPLSRSNKPPSHAAKPPEKIEETALRASSRDDLPTEPPESINLNGASAIAEKSKSSRPSLSDRTIESIQNLPSTPKDRRRSNFFSPVDSPMPPPPRPASSLSRDGSNGASRPGTSDGNFARPYGRPSVVTNKAPASAKPSSRTSLGGFGFTPQRSVSNISRNHQLDSQTSILPSPRSQSPSKQAAPTPKPHGVLSIKPPSGAKTVARARPKPRPSLSDAFGPAVVAGAASDTVSKDETSTQSQANTPKPVKRVASNPSNSSSAALRQQIAAAKAAARKEKSRHDSAQEISTTSSRDVDFDMQVDPFNQVPRDEKHILRNRINAARMDGKLNIAAMGLKQIPEEVMKMYDAEAMEESKVNWAEVVDLTRLNAADNEIEELGDAVFPDVSPEDYALDDQTSGNQFGGLEQLDLHGNKLTSVPIGLGRLERLTCLSLTHNKLENVAMDIISQMENLKELKLGFNALSGTLPTVLCNLQNLETLDLQSNRLLVLPEALRELVSLKVLNVSGNQLTSLPMEALQELNLTDLDASSNALIGALFPPTAGGSHLTLRSLRVANNSLAAITFAESLDLPQLRTLDVTNNHLTVLPRLSGWTDLTTLLASDNKIAELPPGFTTLRKLRNVNFTSNELRLLDPTIARMEGLESLVLASNPLREKKFLNMNAADIKRDLRTRLEPSSTGYDDLTPIDDFHDARDSLSSPLSAASPTNSWTFKSNGELDLAGRGISDDINDVLGSFLQRNEVKHMLLSSNKLTSVPPALWLAQDVKVLDLSGNSLSSLYLSDELELPSLQELNISRCNITTLEPLMTQLHAPNLRQLNLSVNRLTGALPALRTIYPALTIVLAGDNKFTSVTAESLRGLQTVNLASNNIEHLPAEVGLLWDEGLRNLEIGSNSFRVPNYSTLAKGTETTMRFLRNRIPAAQSPGRVSGSGSADDAVD